MHRIAVTGIGNARRKIAESLSGQGAFPVDYPLRERPDADLLFVVYDGLYIDHFLEQSFDFEGEIVPIFFDTDRVLVFGSMKPAYEPGEVCTTCMIQRHKEMQGYNEMYDTVYGYCGFEKIDSILDEEIEIFADKLLENLRAGKFRNEETVYLLGDSFFVHKTRAGYTGCGKCDFRAYETDELERLLSAKGVS
ncbi:hypothetical protein [Saccharibacillus qingshengii]|uniref:hypothetical protein n=1 Tax=Saccharibacillus qingshengii TaxID=1763540 RepID=UPI001557205C|nr:hypothetical protein [Saccharibacillus qingshengii]